MVLVAMVGVVGLVDWEKVKYLKPAFAWNNLNPFVF